MIIDFWKTFIYALRAYVSYVCGELGSTTSKHGGWILADVERKLQIFRTEAVLSFFLPTKQAYTERCDFWAPTWCTFSEGSYNNRITTDSDCMTSQLSGFNSCEFQLSVSFQLFAKTTPNAVDSQQKAALMSGWKQTARKNVASVKVRWCKQPDMTRSQARNLRLRDFIIVCNL